MIYVLFHTKSVEPFRPCMDGLFAAYAAWVRLADCELVPAMYGTAPDLQLTSGDKVFLLDVTYPAAVLEKWADCGAKVTVIDHHKTAMNDLSGLSAWIDQSFDMDKSGAVLAWEYFHPGEDLPLLFEYVQDRDLWWKQMEGCDRIHLGLQEVLHGLSVEEAIDRIDYLGFNEVLLRGEQAEEEINEAIHYAITHHTYRLVDGDMVPFFVCRTGRQFQAYSDIAHALLKLHPPAPFACVQTKGGWALRSDSDRADVSVIAKRLGGGGHRNASGCRAELPTDWWKFWRGGS